jgi:hypothetical protein
MLQTLVTVKTRIKLLFKFFLNASRKDYMRNLESDIGDNINAISAELNKLEEVGLFLSFTKGNKKYFQSNHNHPLFADIQSILMKITGIDKFMKRVLANVGDLEGVFISGKLA